MRHDRGQIEERTGKVVMSRESNFDEIAQQLDLNFKSLEGSAERKFSEGTKEMIRGRCALLIERAKLLQTKPDLSARESKRKGLKIAEEAITAKQGLENLLDLIDRDTLWVFGEWPPPRDWLVSLKIAISAVDEIADVAKRRASLPRKGGHPPFWLFKNFVINLYALYRWSGGRRSVSYSPRNKRYYGAPLFFIREVLAQIEGLIPPGVNPKILPRSSGARDHMIADAIQMYLRRQKTPDKNAEI